MAPFRGPFRGLRSEAVQRSVQRARSEAPFRGSVQSCSVQSFRVQTLSTGTYATTNPFRFSSEYFDIESGLVYYNYRYYSPVLGRWIKRDPKQEKGGWNLYAMCNNNTINRWDYLGLDDFNEVEKKYSDFLKDRTQQAGDKLIDAIKTYENSFKSNYVSGVKTLGKDVRSAVLAGTNNPAGNNIKVTKIANVLKKQKRLSKILSLSKKVAKGVGVALTINDSIDFFVYKEAELRAKIVKSAKYFQKEQDYQSCLDLCDSMLTYANNLPYDAAVKGAVMAAVGYTVCIDTCCDY